MTEPVDLHRRTIRLDCRRRRSDGLEVHGELVDERHFGMGPFLGVEHGPGVVHHMTLDLELDGRRTVRRADADMKTAPFMDSSRTSGEACPQILPRYQGLVGETLDDGFAARLIESFGGALGCFHVLSLAQCVPFALDALASGGGTREIVVRSIALAADRIALEGERTDTGAEPLGLELELEWPRFRIARAEGRGRNAHGARSLEGLAIARGFTGAAIERLDDDADWVGMVVAMTPVTAQAASVFATVRGIDRGSRPRAGSGPVGSCHMWRSDGPLVALTAAPRPTRGDDGGDG